MRENGDIKRESVRWLPNAWVSRRMRESWYVCTVQKLIILSFLYFLTRILHLQSTWLTVMGTDPLTLTVKTSPLSSQPTISWLMSASGLWPLQMKHLKPMKVKRTLPWPLHVTVKSCCKISHWMWLRKGVRSRGPSLKGVEWLWKKMYVYMFMYYHVYWLL